jgi:hypothetical protein
MNLIDTLRVKFDTFENVSISAELDDISDSLEMSKMNHIESPTPGAFTPVGFGSAWIAFHKQPGQPKDTITDLANYLDPFVSSVLSEAVASLIEILASKIDSTSMTPLLITPLANIFTMAPTNLSSIATTLSTTMNSSHSTAISNGQLDVAAQSIVTALNGLASLVRLDKSSAIPYASVASNIDNELNIPVVQVSKLANRRAAWDTTKGLLDLIPFPSDILHGEQGRVFFDSVIFTIKESNIGA